VGSSLIDVLETICVCVLIVIMLVEVRQLLVRRPKYSKPYCVVQFEGSEFVTNEAKFTDETHKHQTGDNVKCNPVWKHEIVLYLSHFLCYLSSAISYSD
jgi:hypothetical protein